jgi:tripartite-type tricarboxylate transporter receptor subunit TctC
MNALHKKTLLFFLAALPSAGNSLAQAPKYPDRPLRLVVPFAPGGGADIVGRAVAQRASETLGQQIVVDNRSGGGGTIGAEIAATARPDGYTLILISASYAISPSLYKLPYDALKDIAPAGLLATGPFVIVVHPSLPVRSVKELIAAARNKPATIPYGSAGTGSITHLASELFCMMAGVRMIHIPYKGTGPAMTDLLGGQIQVIFGTSVSVAGHIKGGKLVPLAVTGPRRMATLPELPTVAESGLPDYEVQTWYGILFPRGVAPEILARWNRDINAMVSEPRLAQRFAQEGLEPAPGSPADFTKVLGRDIDRWKRVVERAAVKVD